MKNRQSNGFTLIELIMVMIILGVLAAVAIPRYLETIEKSEVSAEDAKIDRICVALENFAQHKMLTEGRRYWPCIKRHAHLAFVKEGFSRSTRAAKQSYWCCGVQHGWKVGLPFH